MPKRRSKTRNTDRQPCSGSECIRALWHRLLVMALAHHPSRSCMRLGCRKPSLLRCSDIAVAIVDMCMILNSGAGTSHPLQL